MAKKYRDPREFMVSLKKQVNIKTIQYREIADNQKAFEFEFKGAKFTLVLIKYGFDDYYGYYELLLGSYGSNVQMGDLRDLTATKRLTVDNVVKHLRLQARYF